ncbi:helix-turn-helix domain-containing protein [Evansella sp. LMS18]|uniref:helix-turn-helix domain-containing protein n=1 Tax=Evansella sp. LMS18 TaxID=2924033 RepID=UPI0020D0F6AD|nr:helix-turn-helix domain-containing protein [Evansella sp. LMS18]UTR08948.1 helix-turn-helix domain-containing protein [Evansella sp. LMS18]
MGATVLIADRDKMECQGTEWFLSRSSAAIDAVYTSSCEQKSIELMENLQPDIIIMEIDMFSDESIKRIYALGERPERQFICTSAEATFEQAMRAIRIGAADLLLKPHSPARLYAAVKRSLNKLSGPAPQNSHSQNEETSGNNPFSYARLFGQEMEPLPPGCLISYIPGDKNAVFSTAEQLQSFYAPEKINMLPLSGKVLVYLPKKNKQEWEKEANQFLHFWEERNDTPLSCVIYDNAAPPLKTLKALYEETEDMAEMVFYQGQRKVLSFPEPVKWKTYDPFLSPAEQRKWIDMLNQQDFTAIKEDLYSSFLKIEKPYPSPNLIRTKLTSILAQIRRYMHLFNLTEGTIETQYEATYETILNRPVLYSIVQELYIFIQHVFEEALLKEKQSIYDTVEHAVFYLERNYWNSELRLEDAANSVKRNPSYLSHLFKEKTGLSFRKKLLNIRLQEARRLLLETPLTIKEITVLCGFREASYFSRCFHQQFGASPSAYRLSKGAISQFPFQAKNHIRT